MTVKETPFLAFWRALDAALARIGEPPASDGEAYGYGYDHAYAAAAIKQRRANPTPYQQWMQRGNGGPAFRSPSHQRNAGKTGLGT